MKKHLILLAAIFFSFNTLSFAQDAMPTTDVVLKQAYAQATKENKNVLLIFHASWCGWCKKMEASLNDPTCKKFIDDNYVIAKIDVLERPADVRLENPGALVLLKLYKGEKSGLPFWVILDAKGTLLADSQMRPKGAALNTPGQNTGCPGAPNELVHLVEVLKATSKLNDKQLTVISNRFALNAPSAGPRTFVPLR